MKFILTFCLLICYISLLGQCDSNFYAFKRAIIKKVSAKLEANLNFKIPKQTIKMEFSDYQKFSYIISDPGGTLGFACVRNAACNNYADSLCLCKGQDKYSLYFDRTLFENFMSSDDLKICDSVNYLHTLAKVIDNPIDGWSKVEKFFFRFFDNDDLKKYYNGKSVYITVPVFVLFDKKLKETHLYTVKINGTENENIAIEKEHFITNK